MPKEESFGIIPVHRDENGALSVLIVGKKDPNTGEMWWGFPKGHAEPGETQREAALRETLEETGLTVEKLGEKTYTDRYTVNFDGTERDKTVTYLVGRAPSTAVKIDGIEIMDYRFVPVDLVDHFLTRDGTKAMYCQAEHEVERIGHEENGA